jgi:hypothetical protein
MYDVLTLACDSLRVIEMHIAKELLGVKEMEKVK